MALDFTPTAYLTYGFAPVTAYPWTLACWFWADDITTAHQLFTINDNGGGTGAANNSINMFLQGTVAGDPLRCSVVSAGVSQSSDGGAFSANTWQHAAFVGASATSRIPYMNGTAGTSSTTSSTPSGLNNIRLGSNATLTQNLNGRMAEVAVWDLALSAAEIAALVKGYSPLVVQRRGLRFYAPMFKATA